MRWTFETMDYAGNWTASARRFETMEEALEAMMDWVRVSAKNGTRPGVRLLRY